jgi:hypothetical protein
MLLSDLLHRNVVTATGARLGRVVEVHLIQDALPVPGGDHRLRVDGLVVGRRAAMARLGLTRPEINGPTLVTLVARAIAGHHDYVSWDQIDSLPDTPGADIVVHGEPGDLPPTERTFP